MPLFAAARRKWTGYDWNSSAPHYNKAVVSLGYCCTRSRCRVQARPLLMRPTFGPRRALFPPTPSSTAWSRPMSIMLNRTPISAAPLSVEDVRQLLYREARFLDDKESDSWLELYAPGAEYWMPAWDDDDHLVTVPQKEISLIWC